MLHTVGKLIMILYHSNGVETKTILLRMYYLPGTLKNYPLLKVKVSGDESLYNGSDLRRLQRGWA